MYGAMDHIDKKRDKRPKGSRPEGWDVNYAKEKYERGVPAGELVLRLLHRARGALSGVR